MIEKEKELEQKVKDIEKFEKYDTFSQVTGRDKISINEKQEKEKEVKV